MRSVSRMTAMLHLKKRKYGFTYKMNTIVCWRHRVMVVYGIPVEWHTRGIGLWQVVHQRRPAAPCWREGKRLWPVVIHHFQTPVSIKWHGVT